MIVLLSGWPGSWSAADWPHWLGPDRNGVAAESLPPDFDPDQIAWRAKVGIGFSSLAVAGGRVYTAGHDGARTGGTETLWCLDERTGTVLWADRHEAELLPNLHEGGPAATPSVDGDRVYTLSKDGQVRCLDAATGTLRWSRDLIEDGFLPAPPEWGFSGSPLVIGDRVFLEAGATVALDKRNGAILWKSEPYRPAYGTPAPLRDGESLRLAVLKNDGLVLLDGSDGRTLSFAPWETAFETNATSPIVNGPFVFLSTGYDRGCALFRRDGGTLSKVYENRTLCTHMNNAVLIDGFLYGFDGTAHRGRPTEFVCVEFASGAEQWRVPPGEALGCGSLIATADGTLLILTEAGELVVAPATPEKFRPDRRAQILGGRCWTPPVLANGRVFARNARGDLVAVGPPPAP